MSGLEKTILATVAAGLLLWYLQNHLSGASQGANVAGPGQASTPQSALSGSGGASNVTVEVVNTPNNTTDASASSAPNSSSGGASGSQAPTPISILSGGLL